MSVLAPSVRGSRAPARGRGPAGVLAVAGLFAVLWLVVGPGDGGWLSFAGQLAGAEAVLLMAAAIVLISVLPAVESWFDGIDRAAIWHRRLSVTGMVLVIPHVLFSSGRHGPPPQAGPPTSGGRGADVGGLLAQVGVWGLVALAVWAVAPRWRTMLPWLAPYIARSPLLPHLRRASRRLLGGYERWRALHRLTGLFLAAAFVHGLLDATMFGSRILRWSYLVAGGIGIACYVYRETIARYFLPLHDYQVAAVTTIAPGLTELALTPVGRPLHFTPGQFAMLFLESADGWRRHPFTISSAPHDDVLRFTIKALGDDTTRIQTLVRPGMPAVVGGPHGRFDHTRGTDRQIWIAGGIGITPFLSWLRALDRHPLPPRVDLFYSTVGDAPFAREIADVAAAHPNLRVHRHDSAARGFLAADDVLAAAGTGDDPGRVSVFLCGPAPMVDAFVRRLRRAGVPSRQIHREHFDWR
ncbi:ferredoxin reductase family protein [Dactylosporangium sp. CA-139114]|uniref:ferredoxin reductase family protein n=1 Tax=Dactylosporangium sp. CA-139114 TaxID=3239931 RepID=UPI003D98B367